MKNLVKTNFVMLMVAIVLLGCCLNSFAETTTQPYFHTGAGPIAGIFYFLGDLISLPFRFLGDLLS